MQKINERISSLFAVLLSLPWCCILPFLLSLLGLIAGIGAVRIWTVKVTPFLFIFSILFLMRAHWLFYKKYHYKFLYALWVWASTIIVGILWAIRLILFLTR